MPDYMHNMVILVLFMLQQQQFPMSGPEPMAPIGPDLPPVMNGL